MGAHDILLGVTLRWTSIQGGIEIFLVALCYENQDNPPLDGRLESRRSPLYLTKLSLDILSVLHVGCIYCATQSIQETFSDNMTLT